MPQLLQLWRCSSASFHSPAAQRTKPCRMGTTAPETFRTSRTRGKCYNRWGSSLSTMAPQAARSVSTADTACATGLAQVLSHICNGTIPAGYVTTNLVASRLIPIPKKGSGIRPISIGQILYRLAAKLLMKTLEGTGGAGEGLCNLSICGWTVKRMRGCDS